MTREDPKGVKLRVPEGIWRVRMFKTYGANPTPLACSEVFVALKTGVLDGEENPYTDMLGGKFEEVQKYLTESNHVYTPSFPTARMEKWQSWSPDVQKDHPCGANRHAAGPSCRHRSRAFRRHRDPQPRHRPADAARASVLIASCSIAKTDIWATTRWNIPYVAVLIAVLLLVTYVPATSMALVDLFYR